MVQIVLCMIVKNEAHVIERCLSHAGPVIDAACICDTGSTDGTPEIIERTLEEMGIPHRVCRHVWENFGHNRTRSFQKARELACDLGWDLERSYALTLDADFVLGVSEGFDPDQLTGDGYNVNWIQSPLVFNNMALMRLDLDWRCVGAAHEYWTAGEQAVIEKLETLWVHHLYDGGVAEEKPGRNLQLLEQEYEQLPDNPRTQFYLAQTYFDLGRYEDARALYQKRVETGGWEEETWYARYKAALCALYLGQRQIAHGELLEAWNHRPGRAEPLYALARDARLNNQHHMAMLAAEQAVALGYPVDDHLFIDTPSHSHGPIEEITISAYYAGRLERGAAACDALLHRHGIEEGVRSQASQNMVFYARPIFNHDTAARVEVPYHYLQGGFSSSVGSIRRTSDGYLLVTRLMNYYHENGVSFLTRDPGGQYITRNLALRLSRDLETRKVTEIDSSIVDRIAPHKAQNLQVVGIEDLRLFRWRGEWWFTGNSLQFRGPFQWGVVLGRFNRSATRVDHVVPLTCAHQQFHEKNWMPLVHRGRLYLLYATDPTIVLEPDPDTGECRVVSTRRTLANLDRYRGSTPFIPFNGRLLGIVHDVSLSESRRVYLHRFIVLDPETWTVSHASRPFSFLHQGVEYCCGLTWAHEEQDLLISFSFEERESWVGRLHRDRIRDMLVPVPELPLLKPLPGLGRSASNLPAGGPGESTHVPAARLRQRRWPVRLRRREPARG